MRFWYLGLIVLVLIVVNVFLISRFFKVTAPTSKSTSVNESTTPHQNNEITLSSTVPNTKFDFVNKADLIKRIENLGIYTNGALLLSTKEKVPVKRIDIELVAEPQPINLMMQTDSSGKSTSKHNFDQAYDTASSTLRLKVYTSPYIDYSEVDKQYSYALALAFFESAQTPPKNKAEQDARTQKWLQYTQEFNEGGGQLVKHL